MISTLPSIWDQLSPIPNTQGIPTGGYFFRDLPFLALWGLKYFPFWHPFAAGDTDALGIPVTTPSFIDTVAAGNLPNVSFVDPAFDTEGNGTSADDHPLADIRLGERFIADAYHALADAGYLDNTVFMVTFDEWGGFFDHVPPPHVIDDTDPATVDHTGDGTTPTDGQLIPDYTQLGFRVPAIVVSNLARPGRAPRPVRAHLDAEADRVDVRAPAADGQGRQRQRPRPGAAPRAAAARPPWRDPDQRRGARAGQRRGRGLQRVQRSVGVARPGPPARHGFAEAHVLHKPGYPTGSGMAGFGKEFRKGTATPASPPRRPLRRAPASWQPPSWTLCGGFTRGAAWGARGGGEVGRRSGPRGGWRRW